jgi:vacuolar-type H+-ATPase subunit E/Vma4
MPLAELLGAFERDAAAELRAIADAADADAARIDREGRLARDERIARANATTAAELQVLADRELAEAAHGARIAALAARAAMLDRVRVTVRAELPRLLGTPAVAERLVRAAVACAEGGTGELRCAHELVALARAAAPPTLAVIGDPAIATGIVIELASGIRIDASLATLFDREWPRLACDALALVPGGAP